MRFLSFRHYFVISLLVLLMISLSSGCSSRRKSGASGSSAGVKRALDENSNFVKSALEYTLAIERYEEKGFKERMVENLNTWARSISVSDDWKSDPMINSIPDNFKQMQSVQDIDKIEFSVGDADYLQQSIWAKSIADRVVGFPSPGTYQYLIAAACDGLPKEKIVAIRSSAEPLLQALQSLYPKLTEEQTEQLTRACLIFDWTVRNIQLDEMGVEYEGDAIVQKAKDYVDVPTGNAPRDGVEGPGYTKTPGQVLLTGKGDTWQKSRAFMILCRQIGIETVMLNVIDRNDETKRVPWVVGVLIGEQLLLFDLEMGLPLPGKDYRRIATYQEVQADRSILTQLKYKLSESIDANPDYRIQPAQLDKVIAWIDASPESMSRKMELLEPKLVGDYKAIITYAPTRLKSILEKKQFHAISLSPIPFQNSQYRNTFEEAITRGKEKALIKNYLEQEYFKIRIPIKKIVRKNQVDSQTQSLKSGRQLESVQVTVYLLSEARHRFLLGVYESDMKNGKMTLGARKLSEDLDVGRDTQDAAQMFVTLTLDDNRIGEILTDDDWLAIMGLSAQSNTNMSDQELSRFKSIFEAAMKLIRTDAVVWLAITNFETGDFANAKNWLEQIPRFDNTNKWTDLTSYNLARTEEALFQYPQAIKMYRGSRSQQKFGNIIRSRLIQRWNLADPSATAPE
ncbi:MAG: hypothetical protein VX438_04930 [Planctomycetota bacterium]|nr:hypothetical protein [Planctomycetota bacterium]